MIQIVGFVLSGLIIGLLARALKPGNDRMGLGMTTILGMAGAVLAGWVGHQIGWYAEGGGAGFFVSTLGAILILSLFYALTRRNSVT